MFSVTVFSFHIVEFCKVLILSFNSQTMLPVFPSFKPPLPVSFSACRGLPMAAWRGRKGKGSYCCSLLTACNNKSQFAIPYLWLETYLHKCLWPKKLQFTGPSLGVLACGELFLPEIRQRLQELELELQSTGKENVVLSCCCSGDPAGHVYLTRGWDCLSIREGLRKHWGVLWALNLGAF